MVQFNSSTPSGGTYSASINCTRNFFFFAAFITSGLWLFATLHLTLEVSQHYNGISPKTSTLKIPPPVNGGGTIESIICPSAMNLFANKTKLNEFIAKNVHYHQHGGNLESIDKYLNSHMQSSLDRLGLQFFPNNDNEKPVSNIAEYLKTYYQSNNVPRGGYGQPLPGKFSTGPNLALFEKRWINVLEPSTMERFTAGIGPVGPECSDKITVSKGTYEEKSICVENSNNYMHQCNIVSIGSNDQWGFEREITENSKLRGCIIHTFDCTLPNNKPKRKPKSDNVKFYPYCIGWESQKPPYLPYDQLWSLAKTKHAPKVLKMDVEGFEYDVILNSILTSNSSLWPEQIVMEVHWGTRMVRLPWMPRTRTAAELALFFGVMFNRGGYIIQQTKFVSGCPTCMEVLLVRAVCYETQLGGS